MARAADQTLDVEQDKFLVAFHDDETYTWHHRVLLLKAPDQTCIWLTPDGGVGHVDLCAREVRPLRRAAPFPPALLGDIYYFDPMEKG